MLIQVSMKFIVTQREIIGIKFELIGRVRPPRKYVALFEFHLHWSLAYNPHIG